MQACKIPTLVNNTASDRVCKQVIHTSPLVFPRACSSRKLAAVMAELLVAHPAPQPHMQRTGGAQAVRAPGLPTHSVVGGILATERKVVAPQIRTRVVGLVRVDSVLVGVMPLAVRPGVLGHTCHALLAACALEVLLGECLVV